MLAPMSSGPALTPTLKARLVDATPGCPPLAPKESPPKAAP